MKKLWCRVFGHRWREDYTGDGDDYEVVCGRCGAEAVDG